MKIFEMNEYDWVVANSREEAVKYYQEYSDLDEDDVKFVKELQDGDLDTYRFHPDLEIDGMNGPSISFREQFNNIIKEKQEIPTMFASREY